MIHFGVMHLPTPERASLLRATVSSLVDAGADRISIYRDEHKTGPTANLIRSLKAIAEEQSAHDALVCIVDDDLVFAPGAAMRAYAAALAVPPGSVVALWTIEQNIPHEKREERLLVRVVAGVNTWGGCVVMPQYMAKMVAERMREEWKRDERLGRSPDGCLFSAIGAIGLGLYHPVPSLVDHAGLQASTIGNNHEDGATRGYRFNEWTT